MNSAVCSTGKKTLRRLTTGLAFSAVLCAQSSAQAAEYTLTSKNNSGFTLRNAEGKVVGEQALADDPNDVVRHIHTDTDNVGWGYTAEIYRLVLDATNVTTSAVGPWCDNGGVLKLGAGGLHVAANNLMDFANSGDALRVKLLETQTWSGPETGTDWGYFRVGAGRYGSYVYGSMGAAGDDVRWTLDGRILVTLARTNDLGKVDVVVNPKARLVLRESFENGRGKFVTSGRLNAKSVTFAGVDPDYPTEAAYEVGKAPTHEQPGGGWSNVTPYGFDDETLAPTVTLQNGASVAAGTDGKARYGLTQLNVTGGDSTFSGTVTITNDATISIAAGASFAFTGTYAVEAGRTVTLTGEGAFKVGTEAETLPFAGTGVVEIDASGEREVVLSQDLSGFTGTIRAKGGKVFVLAGANLPAGATFEAESGSVCKRLEASDLVRFVEDGRTYDRAADGRSHAVLYANKFSSNTYVSSLRFRSIPDVEAQLTFELDSTVVFDRESGGGVGSWGKTYGIELPAYVGSFYVETSITLGAGGIKAGVASQVVPFYINGQGMNLTASQTWQGPESDVLTSPATFTVGGDLINDWAHYTTTLIGSTPGIELTIAGNAIFRMQSSVNDFSTGDVRIVSPAWGRCARLLATDAYGTLHARKLTLVGATGGWCFGAKTVSSCSVGSPAVLSPEAVAATIALEANAPLQATEATTWTGTTLEVVAGSVSPVTGAYQLLDAETLFTVAAGATLDLTGATFTADAGAKIVVNGAGTVRVSQAALAGVPGGIQVTEGATIQVVGSEWSVPVTGDATLALASNGSVYLAPSVVAGLTGTVAVSSGDVVLDGAPNGFVVNTSGTGALALLDWTGFDPDTQMTGTKSTDAQYTITDRVYAGETFAVGENASVAIYGDGLTADTAVTLATGAKIVFRRTATVASPLTVEGAARVCSTGADVVGTFAGGVTATKSLSIAGGAIRMTTGDVVVPGTIQVLAGKLTFEDTKVSSSVQNGVIGLASDQQFADAQVVFGPGSSITFGNNQHISIGRVTAYESRFTIDGGTVSFTTPDLIYLCANGTGKGVLEIKSGTLNNMQRLIWVGIASAPEHHLYDGATARVIWSGGTIQHYTTNGYTPYKGLIYGNASFELSGDLTFNFGYNDSGLAFFDPDETVGSAQVAPGTRLMVKGYGWTDEGKNNLLTLNRGDYSNLMVSMKKGNKETGLVLEGAGEPVCVGWKPSAGCTVACSGMASPLLVNREIAAGETFDAANVDTSWATGFTSVTTKNLTLADGATLRFPFFGSATALAIAGTLALPDEGTLNYEVTTLGPRVAKAATPVITADGVTGTPAAYVGKGAFGRNGTVTTTAKTLDFAYAPTGLLLLVK